jgi:UDP-glucose 4-epimerase
MTPPASDYGGVRVAVLGAAGFVGRWVARALCARGAEVTLVVRCRTAAEETFASYAIHGEAVSVDLSDPGAVRALFSHVRPAITFNLAGYGVDRSERDPASAYRINAELVRTMCDALAQTKDPGWPGQHIVHAGSAAEYGRRGGGDLAEDSAPRPTTPYARSKLAGTRLLARGCRVRGLRGLTARLFTVYGPGEHEDRLFPSLLRAASTGDPLSMTAGQQTRDFTYVEDVAAGLLRLGVVAASPCGIVNLATGRLTSVRVFAETAGEILRLPADRLRFGALPDRSDEMEHREVTLERLRRLVGWVPPTGIAEGIRRSVQFERGRS